MTGVGHLSVREFDCAGDQVRATDTTVVPTPPGVVKLLHRHNVVAVELHFNTGDSVEFRLPGGDQ